MRAWCLALPLLLGCGDSASMMSGTEAALRVRNARFVRAAFPQGADADANGIPSPDAGSAPQGAPVVAVLNAVNTTVRQGQRAKEFTGSVSYNARTVAVGLEGDRGYWLVPIEAQDIELPPNLTFRAIADFADDLPVARLNLLVAGVDAAGRFGPRRALPLDVRSSIPDTPVAVVLDWDQDVDLDLLVVQPDGSTVTYRGVRNAAGQYFRPVADGPRVDIDSNVDCRIDGIRRETATFPAPQHGRHEVRVHLFRACGVAATRWRVRVAVAGSVVQDVRGVTYAQEADTPGGRPWEDGARALEFAVP